MTCNDARSSFTSLLESILIAKPLDVSCRSGSLSMMFVFRDIPRSVALAKKRWHGYDAIGWQQSCTTTSQ